MKKENEIEAIQKKIEEAEELAKLNLYIEELQEIHNIYLNFSGLTIFDKEKYASPLVYH
jgi:hypothetical protein